ncbi:hypothetical protein BC835DRAFT_884613 [Cytidiella melzeri]|nr:hypothetical protein BC835DRAFT_884613 [Cytidiella melzeri]
MEITRPDWSTYALTDQRLTPSTVGLIACGWHVRNTTKLAGCKVRVRLYLTLQLPNRLDPMVSIIVPQTVYASPSPGSRQPPIQFSSNGAPGVSLQSALNPSYNGLTHGTQLVPLPESAGTSSISICIQWPGYPPMRKNINFTEKMNGKLTYRMLAMMTAKIVQQCMMEMASPNVRSSERSSDWWASAVPFESLSLLELRHISPGLWQPVLYRDV